MKLQLGNLHVILGRDLLRQHLGDLVQNTPVQEIKHSIPIIGEILIRVEDFTLLDLQTDDDGFNLKISFRVKGQPIRRMLKMKVDGILHLDGRLFFSEDGRWLKSLQFNLSDLRWAEVNLKDFKWAIEKVTDVLESKIEEQLNEKIGELATAQVVTNQIRDRIKPIAVDADIILELCALHIHLQNIVFNKIGVMAELGLNAEVRKAETRSPNTQTDVQLIDERNFGDLPSEFFISMAEVNEILRLSIPRINKMGPAEQIEIEGLVASSPAPQRLQIDIFTSQLKKPLVTLFHIWLDDRRQTLELLDFDLNSHSEASIITKGLVKIFREKVEEKVQSIFPMEVQEYIPMIISIVEEKVGHLVDVKRVDLELSELSISEEGVQLNFISDVALSLQSIESR